jgi:hypothetical protein
MPSRIGISKLNRILDRKCPPQSEADGQPKRKHEYTLDRKRLHPDDISELMPMSSAVIPTQFICLAKYLFLRYVFAPA